MSAQAFIEIDGKRFLRTGDLGRVDEDGYFFMVDRLKRMINASGFKVWPTEVESLMYQHPAVLEACVIGASDAHRGETVKALVVLRPEWQGRIEAPSDHRLVPREHGGLQGPEHRRIHRCAAQIGQRQDSVARTAGSRTAGRSRAQRRGRARWLSMRALLEPPARRSGDSGTRRDSRASGRSRRGAGRGARLRRQFPGFADHSGSLSGQAPATVRPRRRDLRHRRCARHGRRGFAGRRSRAHESGPRRYGSESRRSRGKLLENSRCDAFRRSSRAASDLWHLAARAQGSSAAQARRDAARARRRRRRRPRRGGIGQGHGRARGRRGIH